MIDTQSEPVQATFERLESVQTTLQVLRRATGLRIAVVARVTDTTWTACAVLGDTSFGLQPGDMLPLYTTFCDTVRTDVAPLRINHASRDPRFETHPARTLYGIESYIAVPIHRHDGSLFGVLCALDAEPAELSDDSFEMFHLLAELITFELEADERQRQQAVTVRALEDFIAVAAHDLRQPLTTVLARTQMLARQIQREDSSAKLMASVTTLLNQTQRAVLLSETLLDLAHVEAGSFILDLAECDLVVLANDVLDDTKTTALAHELILAAPTTVLMQVDERRMRQVLRNLVDNAIKYTAADAGPIVLRIAPLPHGGAQISVQDRGSGVTPVELPNLFTRHYRAANALGQGTSGSGLGLYIVRKIIEAHGGTVNAELAMQGGLIFTISLPVTLNTINDFSSALSVDETAH